MCLYKAQISGERLQDHWSSGFIFIFPFCRAIFLLHLQQLCTCTIFYQLYGDIHDMYEFKALYENRTNWFP